MSYKKTRCRNVYKRESGKYCYRYINEHGKEVQRAGTRCLATTEKWRRHAEDRAADIRNGRIDPRREEEAAQARAPLAPLIDEYEQYLLVTKGSSKRHVADVKAAIKAVVKAMGAGCVADFDTTAAIRGVKDFLAGLLANALSYRTYNHYLISISGFLNWVALNRRGLSVNPLRVIVRLDEDLDRKRLSRALTPDEFASVLEHLPDTVRGRERRAYYVVCAHTGIRWRELRRLTWQDVDFESRQIRLPITATKNKKMADLPMSKVVLEALFAIRLSRSDPSGVIFSREPRLRTWKRDVKRAEIPYVDVSGRIADRKCLRKTFGTWLKEAGVDLRDAQRLLRHQDPKITAMIYSDPRMPVLLDAVEKVSAMCQKYNAKEHTCVDQATQRATA